MSRNLLSLSLAATLLAGSALADVPDVSVDIAPIHSLVARVMLDIGEPDLIVAPGASPHEYSLRPSEAQALQDAQLVFWVGPSLTPWLGDAVETLAGDAEVITLSELEGTMLLPMRGSALFESHDHGHDEDHAHEDDAKAKGHEHDHDDEHDHDAHGQDEQKDHADMHDHGAYDTHVWLSPANASTWLSVIAAKLSAADPENASAYTANAAAGQKELTALSQEINEMLDPVRNKTYVVFHDAYQYFEQSFDIPASGAISISDASDPSPGRIAEIQARVAEQGISCVLSEPQFNPGIVSAVMEGSEARTGLLDPLGSDLEPGPNLYPNLLRNLAKALAECL